MTEVLTLNHLVIHKMSHHRIIKCIVDNVICTQFIIECIQRMLSEMCNRHATMNSLLSRYHLHLEYNSTIHDMQMPTEQETMKRTKRIDDKVVYIWNRNVCVDFHRPLRIRVRFHQWRRNTFERLQYFSHFHNIVRHAKKMIKFYLWSCLAIWMFRLFTKNKTFV